MTSWCLTFWVPHVRLRCVWHVNFSWISCARFGHLSHIFPSYFLFFEISFSVLHFLVSSSCSSLCFCSSMVDYSFVKADCPSVSFPFTHLGCLLEIVEGKHLKGVSVFVGEDCQYRFVLLHFLWFLVLLKWLGFWKCLGRLGLVSWKRVYLRLMIARFPWLLPLLFPIKHGTSHVPS